MEFYNDKNNYKSQIPKFLMQYFQDKLERFWTNEQIIFLCKNSKKIFFLNWSFKLLILKKLEIYFLRTLSFPHLS